MTTSPARPNADNLRRLDEMRTTYERLRTERIRAESEVERLAAELEQVRESARAAFGTDDEGEIGRLIEEARARNAELVAEFETLVRDIDRRLRALGGGR
jgi:phage shock protein A